MVMRLGNEDDDDDGLRIASTADTATAAAPRRPSMSKAEIMARLR